VKEMLEQLGRWPAELAPLDEAVRRWLPRSSRLSARGMMCIGHQPWVAPEGYAITLYPGLTREDLARYCQRFQLQVPPIYADFLQWTNGAFLFGMSLAGVPQSMLEKGLLDRQVLQCHDLATCATSWTHEFRGVPAGAFHFGSRDWSSRAIAGYFIWAIASCVG
jgi:hypothetical protein